MSDKNTVSYTHDIPPRTGILLTNLGTPDAPTAGALRRYLAEFLADPRVVEVPRPVWLPLLYGVILPFRAPKSAEAYRRIWTTAGSPLLVNSLAQMEALQAELGRRFHGPFSLALGMRYGNPSIADALRQLRADNVQRLLVLPLYPQYSAATTASTFDAVSAELARWRWQPELRTVNGYWDTPGYVNALADSVREYWEREGRGQHLLFSFHGLPRRNLELGDPYHCFCRGTARRVAQALELDDAHWSVAFQSRVGPAEWLQPYTDEVIKDFGRKGMNRLDVICPGFSADCLETLEEIELRYGEQFRAAGGGELNYIPALNARPGHVRFLADLVMQHVQGWPEASSMWNRNRVYGRLAEARQRAEALGAPR